MTTLSIRALARAAFVPATVALLAFDTRADVIVVAPSGGQHAQIQAAVAAANPGDVILVRAGTYAAVAIDAKPLTVSADAGASVTVAGTIVVSNIAAGDVVVLSGLIGRPPTSNSVSETDGLALAVRTSSGFVRVEGCDLAGAKGWGDGGFILDGSDCCTMPAHDHGWDGVHVEGSPRVSFTACTIQAGRGANADDDCYCGSGDFGGIGLRVTNSTVSVHDSSIRGGTGGGNGGRGGNGGVGLRIQAPGGVIASNSLFGGGNGGNGYDYIYSEGGTGGTGVLVGSGAAIQHIGCTFTGGAGGLACYGLFPPGANGVPEQIFGLQFEFLVPSASLQTSRVVREGATLALTVRGKPGALASLRTARQPAFVPIPSQRGVVFAETPFPARTMLLGEIPGNGILQASFPVSQLAVGTSARTCFLQLVVHDATDGITLGNGTALLVLDSAF